MRKFVVYYVLISGIAAAVAIGGRPVECQAANAVVQSGYDLFHTVSATAPSPLGNLTGVPLNTFDFGNGNGPVNVGNADTIVERTNVVSEGVGHTGTTGLRLDALQLQSTTTPGLYVTLNTGTASTGSMAITFTTATSGTFSSTLDVFYDVRSGSVTGSIVGHGEDILSATNIAWGRTAPAGAVLIAGINYQLNGLDTSQDFWPGPVFTEFEPNPPFSHTVTAASVPEPSTWIMGVTAVLIVAAYGRWRAAPGLM